MPQVLVFFPRHRDLRFLVVQIGVLITAILKGKPARIGVFQKAFIVVRHRIENGTFIRQQGVDQLLVPPPASAGEQILVGAACSVFDEECVVTKADLIFFKLPPGKQRRERIDVQVAAGGVTDGFRPLHLPQFNRAELQRRRFRCIGRQNDTFLSLSFNYFILTDKNGKFKI